MLTRALALLALLLPAFPAAAEPRILEKDFALFLDWFEGTFDNTEQVYFQKEMEIDEALRHGHITSIFTRVDLPEVGDHVYYVEQYAEGDPANIYRQRIYEFDLDAEKQAIVLHILTLPDAGAVVGAHHDPSLLSGLSRDDLDETPGCEVYWRRRANQFEGTIPDGACRVESPRLGKTLIIDDDLLLTENEIWIADRAETVEGEDVYGHPDGVAHKLRKARPFTCWAAIRTGEGEGDWQFFADRKIHDQGGRLWLTADQGAAPQTLGLRMRNVEWPFGPNRPALVLYVHEQGEPERAISYAWADPDAVRVGINLRWMQASCTLDGAQ